MPYIVQEIIKENPDLVTVRGDESVQAALALMIEHEFSQLPIVDENDKPDGMITSESILHAINRFGVDLENLIVDHARIKAKTVRDDSDLFELLDRLRDTYAVLIVDGDGCLTGIVTNYDSAEYFRRRAEDIMHVEDIESLIKEYIQASYKNGDEEVDEARLSAAIQKITRSDKEQQETFLRALRHYLRLQTGKGAKPDPDTLDEVLNRHYKKEQPPRKFDQLTLNEYIALLLQDYSWRRYRPIFNLDRNTVRNLLERVRDTRNTLAHFRGEINQIQREQLRWTSKWLARHMDAIDNAFSDTVETPELALRETAPVQYYSVPIKDPAEIVPAEDEAEPGESRYASLAIWLQNQPPRKNLVKPSFSDIEKIIGGLLPPSAYEHRAWWANDSVGHVQSQQWLDVGWRVSSINMTSQVVRFSRMRDRQKAYIDFFSGLLNELRRQPGLKNIYSSPSGVSWHLLESIAVKGTGLASFTLAFGRGKKFRIELYIDSGDRAINKQLFDGLKKQQEEIEKELDQSLLWQRLDKKRASRIAIVFENVQIISLQSELDALQRKAIPATVEFRKVMLPRAQQVGRKIV